ncbi:MAG: uroporphyrinogen-III synthase [Rhodomicrobium sp.]|nr:uroporphyrinogen-III synthase [Rhodomicrobium sp.]
MMRIIVTRSTADARAQATRLKALGHEPLVHPLLDIVFPELSRINFAGIQGLIVTSRNALRGLRRNTAFAEAQRLPVFCVGEATADLAREYGFAKVVAGEGTAKELVPLIVQSAEPEAGPLLYVTGQHLAFNLEAPLKKNGFTVPRIIVYEARPPSDDAARRLADALREGVPAVILMSPRTAEIFAGIIKRFKLEGEAAAITCYCISDAVAEPLRDIAGLTVAVSSNPTEADLMELIGPAPFQSRALADLKEVLGKH